MYGHFPVCTPLACLVSVEAREGIRSLQLELQIAVSCYVGAWNSTQILCKSNWATKPSFQAHLLGLSAQMIKFHLNCICIHRFTCTACNLGRWLRTRCLMTFLDILFPFILLSFSLFITLFPLKLPCYFCFSSQVICILLFSSPLLSASHSPFLLSWVLQLLPNACSLLRTWSEEPQMRENIWHCLSASGLLHSIRSFLIPSIYLQISWFYFS